METIVQRQYDWKGNLKAYRKGGSFIPIDDRNVDYQAIKLGVENGTHRFEDPKVVEATKTYGKRGEHTGYFCVLGFVPLDPTNKLYQIVEEAIRNGECKFIEPQSLQNALDESKRIESLLLYIFFDRPWPHLSGPYSGTIGYSTNATSMDEYSFTLVNLPHLSPSDKVKTLLDYKSCAMSHLPNFHLTFGVLEIEVPVKNLRKLFRHEIATSTSRSTSFLDDLAEQNRIQHGRTKKDGPEISWLINSGNLYLGQFVADFSNRVVEAFWLEYGDEPVGYVSTLFLQRNWLSLKRLKDGSVDFHSFFFQPKHNFQLSGEWKHSVGLAQLNSAMSPTIHPQMRALHRVAMMARTGFHMEAITLLNAFLEVNVLETLMMCMHGEDGVTSEIKTCGHRQRLELMKLIAQAENLAEFHLSCSGFLQKILAAQSLYRHRNDYVHDLKTPGDGRFFTISDRQKLEEILSEFSDAHEQMQWFGWTRIIADGYGPVRELIRSNLSPKP